MTLIDLLKNMKRAEAKDFATRCATSVGQLRQVAYGARRAGESLAINIERESHGLIRCEDLRPDVDWQYIRNSKEDTAA